MKKKYKMKRIAVFPGSFDPITKGHESIVLRAASLFDEIIVAIGDNSEKKSLFPIEERLEWIKTVFSKNSNIFVETYSGLTVDFCKQKNAKFILRGLRTSADFEFERSIGQTNKLLDAEIETVFLLTTSELSSITSSIVREVYKHNGDVSPFIPEIIKNKF